MPCDTSLRSALLNFLDVQHPAELATFMGPLPDSLEAPLAHSNSQRAPHPFRVGMLLRLGLGDQETAFVTWRANVNEVSSTA